MTDEPPIDDTRSLMSALADGDAQVLDAACRRWRGDEDARCAWHTYHLIGDVMRSEEFARPPAVDANFLAGVRARLAAEPVVLAPTPSTQAAEPAARARRHQPWLVPAAAVAGFALVAGVLVVTRSATAPAPATFASASSGPALAAPNAGTRREVTFIRDQRLDEFLRAHQLARGGVGVAPPGGALRRADVVVPAEPAR